MPQRGPSLVERLLHTLLGRELEGADAFGEACLRLVEAGLPVDRASMGVRVLNPSIRAVNLVWRPETGPVELTTGHAPDAEAAFRRSPIGVLSERDQRFGRWRLPDKLAEREVTLLPELSADGLVDYAMWLLRVPGNVGAIPGVAVSFATRRPAGFDAAELAQLESVAELIALASIRFTLDWVLAGLMATYLGPRTGGRVLAGEIRRGEGQAIEAAVLLTDLRGFTAWSERLPPSEILPRLDRHFEAIGPAIADAGGEILKFLGDGLIAIFPAQASQGGDACRSALAAARACLSANDASNRAEVERGGTGLGLDIALAFGEVVWGNIGTLDRLDFTVIGAAVNEAARLEGLCDVLDRPVLLSGEVAKRLTEPLEPLGLRSLHGFSEPRQVWAPARLDQTAQPPAAAP